MHLLEKIADFCKKEFELAYEAWKKLAKTLEKDFTIPSFPNFLSHEQSEHFYNLAALLLPYTIVSLLIYPKFSLYQFLQEIFSLLCIYIAIFFWFMDKISHISRYRIVLGVTACAIPIIFLNNSFAVALISLGSIVFIEFICVEYMRGCALFSDKIPIYVVCGDTIEADIIKSSLKNEYKILKLIIADFERVKKLRKKLNRLNMVSFFPFPRRILYFSRNQDIATLLKLVDISSEFSIPLFEIKEHNSEFSIAPISIKNFDSVDVSPQEKNMLAESFKNKSVWIVYDGRKCIFDLICALSEAANLVIFCMSEYLMREIEEELGKKTSEKIHKIKIADKNLLNSTDPKPDILFFNMPLLRLDSSEDNLKEAVAKNVLNTSEIVDMAQKLKIKFVFMLSTMETFDTENWIGATQRLGELIVQCSGSKKAQTKFRIIRLPNCITDPSGLFDEIVESLVSGKNVEFKKSNVGVYCSRDEIFHPLIKLVSYTLRDSYILSDIYSIMPANKLRNIDSIVDIACKLLGIRMNKDVKFLYTDLIIPSEERFSGMFEETDIDPAIVCTRFSATSLKSREAPSWTFEQLNKMSTRDVIATVFQGLKEKDKAKNGTTRRSNNNADNR